MFRFGIPPASGDILPYAQAILTRDSKRKILLVNKTNKVTCVSLPSTGYNSFFGGLVGYTYTVDNQTGDGPARKAELTSTKVTLAPFAVTVVELQ
jgi:hypothetical protein